MDENGFITTPVESKVPCNGCTICCRKNKVTIYPQLGDHLESYQYQVENDNFILASKENGDCIYLGDNGCTIYNRRPFLCKIYDCRVVMNIERSDIRRRAIELLKAVK